MKVLMFLLSWCLLASAHASSYVIGDTVAPLSLQDQHEHSLSLTTQTRVVLFSRDMKGGDIIKEALEIMAEKRPDNLVYVADISGMPSLIAKYVAIPKMRELAFSIALDTEGEQTRLWPATKEAASVIILDSLKVIEVSYFVSSDALVEALMH